MELTFEKQPVSTVTGSTGNVSPRHDGISTSTSSKSTASTARSAAGSATSDKRQPDDYAKVDVNRSDKKPQESALSLLLGRSRESSEPPDEPDADTVKPVISDQVDPRQQIPAASARVRAPMNASVRQSAQSVSRRQQIPLAGLKMSAAAESRSRSGSVQAMSPVTNPSTQNGYGFLFGAGEIGNMSSPRHYSVPAARERALPASVEARFIVNLPRTPSASGLATTQDGAGFSPSPTSSRSSSVASIHSTSSFLSRSLSKMGLSRSNSRMSGSSVSLRRFTEKPWKGQYSPDEGAVSPTVGSVGSQFSTGPLSGPASRAGSFSSAGTAFDAVAHNAHTADAPYVSQSYSKGHGFGSSSSIAGSAGTEKRTLAKAYGKLGKTLGEGAGGHVKIVKSAKNGKIYAVKEFRAKHSSESAREYNKKVGAEYCLGLTLKHPNIVTTLDIIHENDRVFQVMEYCEFDLFAIVMSGKMTVGEAFCDFRQIMDGIRYLHESGLAHRDLKLDNCVVSGQGIVKIIDFGSSVVYRYPESDRRYDCDGIVGSDPYLAPEAAGPQRYDPTATDIWSAAIILCCMLMRKFPWKAPRMSDAAFKSFVYVDPATGERPGLQKLLNSLPVEVRPLIEGMIDLDPVQRFDIEQCWADTWLTAEPHCSLDEHGNVVFGARNHTHTTVSFEDAHIALLERKNRKAKKGEKMW